MGMGMGIGIGMDIDIGTGIHIGMGIDIGIVPSTPGTDPAIARASAIALGPCAMPLAPATLARTKGRVFKKLQ